MGFFYLIQAMKEELPKALVKDSQSQLQVRSAIEDVLNKDVFNGEF